MVIAALALVLASCSLRGASEISLVGASSVDAGVAGHDCGGGSGSGYPDAGWYDTDGGGYDPDAGYYSLDAGYYPDGGYDYPDAGYYSLDAGISEDAGSGHHHH